MENFEKLKEDFDSYVNMLSEMYNKDPNQLALPLPISHDINFMKPDNWIPVDPLKYDQLIELGEVIGFNPDWVDEDCNPNGLRICCFSGEYWESAKYCMYHDQYEHRPRVNEDFSSDCKPLFICHLPSIPTAFRELIKKYQSINEHHS
jgi:hypothetical protein